MYTINDNNNDKSNLQHLIFMAFDYSIGIFKFFWDPGDSMS
jgi:hypothetical protein